ncbi:hypothetical protein Bbelb_117220 [Branchiostoma belcheri]|nr:hypothetical protein Bbelb_117220 [Branchiostoma belcheri]
MRIRGGAKGNAVMLLLLAAASIASNGPRFPRCRRAGWRACVPFTGKPGLDPVKGVCVVCEVLNGGGVSRGPFRFLSGVNGVAIRGYPFHVLSSTTLAPLEQAEVHFLALRDAKITDVKNNTFSWLSRLERLSLDSNKLTNVKQTWFTDFTSLLTLVLSNNSIKQIESGSFKDLTRLLFLDLENNMSQAVDPTWFSGLEGLQLTWVDLRDNELSCLSEEVLWGQFSLSRFHASSRVLSSVYDVMPHGMKWSLDWVHNVIGRLGIVVFFDAVKLDGQRSVFGISPRARVMRFVA